MSKKLIVMLDVPSMLSVDENKIVSDFTSKFIELFGGEFAANEAVNKAIEIDPDIKIEPDDICIEMPINRIVSEQYDSACAYAYRCLSCCDADALRISVGLRLDA